LLLRLCVTKHQHRQTHHGETPHHTKSVEVAKEDDAAATHSDDDWLQSDHHVDAAV
jgi:hypothetical protein